MTVTRLLPYWLVSRAVGLLLLGAAALKLQGLGVDAVGRLGFFSTPEFQLAVVEVEVFLGLWLLSGLRPAGSWMAALATFCCFAPVSLYLASVGETSCGCFGRIHVNPWHALGLDVSVIGALLVGRPALNHSTDQAGTRLTGALLPAVYGIAGVAVISALLIGTACVRFGSLPAALAYLRGERVSVGPRLVDLGEGASGEQREVSVELTNWTEKPVRLVGGTTDCSCTVMNDLPVTIPPKETRSVSVRLRLSNAPGIFTRRAAFLVDDEGFKRVDFALTGRVTAEANE